MDHDPIDDACLYEWFSPYFDDYEMPLAEEGSSTLKLTRLLSMKVDEPDYHHEIVFASAVYLAEAKTLGQDGQSTAREVIVKIWMQIPNLLGTSGVLCSPEAYAHQAKDCSNFFVTEADRLDYLTQKNCRCTPHLIASIPKLALPNPYVPGGFLHMIVMELVPGQRMSEVWSSDPERLPLDKQDLIQEKFIDALAEVQNLGIFPEDQRLDNILWDDKTKKCYLIDFEYSNHERPPPWNLLECEWSEKGAECFSWGLPTIKYMQFLAKQRSKF